MVVCNVLNFASTFIYYIQNLIEQIEIDIQEKSGLNFIFDFNNPKGVITVDMGSAKDIED